MIKGLGLSITSDLLKMINGKIEVKSSVGRGSKFIVNIELDYKTDEMIKDKLKKVKHEDFIVIHRNIDETLNIESYLLSMGARSVFSKPQEHPEKFILILDQNKQEIIPDENKYHKVFYIGDNEYNADNASILYLKEPIQLLRFNDSITKFEECDIQEKKRDSIKNEPKDFDLKKMKILIVEDNLVIHKLEKKLLENKGVEFIKSAFNGQEALDLIEKYDFDCILMDIMMPILDGIETMKVIRQHPNINKRETPIVIITGNSVYDQKNCIINGANEVLSKPINTESLINLLIKFSQSQAPK